MKKDNSILELTTNSGEVIKFYDIADIIYEGEYYAIMQPVELLEGMEEDEALVFRINGPDEASNFELVDDDDIIDGVFGIYLRLLNEDKKK